MPRHAVLENKSLGRTSLGTALLFGHFAPSKYKKAVKVTSKLETNRCRLKQDSEVVQWLGDLLLDDVTECEDGDVIG